MLGKWKTYLGWYKPPADDQVNRIERWLRLNSSKVSIREIPLKYKGMHGAEYLVAVWLPKSNQPIYRVLGSAKLLWQWVYRMHRNYPSTSRYSSHR